MEEESDSGANCCGCNSFLYNMLQVLHLLPLNNQGGIVV